MFVLLVFGDIRAISGDGDESLLLIREGGGEMLLNALFLFPLTVARSAGQRL